MVNYCVLTGCRSRERNPTLHKFPTDPKIRELWTDFVRKVRPCWLGPTQHSYICSEHFEIRYFSNYSKLAKGLSTRLFLTADAVPTVYPVSVVEEFTPLAVGDEVGMSATSTHTASKVRIFCLNEFMIIIDLGII